MENKNNSSLLEIIYLAPSPTSSRYINANLLLLRLNQQIKSDGIQRAKNTLGVQTVPESRSIAIASVTVLRDMLLACDMIIDVNVNQSLPHAPRQDKKRFHSLQSELSICREIVRERMEELLKSSNLKISYHERVDL